ncbi:MAG: DUF5606 domain-containing protein [Bacteroidales bacterium]|nr:DUF5606 domain-containing protein [Candidatus Colimorpha onthohippi]
MKLSNILVISGKSGLSELVSQTKSGAIVRNLETNLKSPVFKNDRISSLGEIRIFTIEDDILLSDVFQKIYDHLQAQPVSFDPKKAENSELFELFGTVLPNYDKDRVHASDVRKVFSWYNILLAAGKLVEDEPSETESNNE